MARTSVNVIGNCLATVVIAKWEGEFHPPADDLVAPNENRIHKLEDQIEKH
jgi:proton glutamate symport protein